MTDRSEFSDVADNAPAILWVTDAQGSCTYLNRRWYETTGQRKDEALGFGWTNAVHPEDSARAAQAFIEANERRASFQIDYRLRRRDGVYLDAIDMGQPRFDQSGAFLGFVGCVVDITERKELERRLFQSQKMDAIGRLAAGIAHDFNNLLTSIGAHAHLIACEIQDPAVLADVRQIEHAVQRAGALTSQLLAFSRQQVLRPRDVDLNRAIQEAERLFSRIIGEDVELRLQFSDDLPPVLADPAQLDQILLNLVVNARDAMPGGGTLRITTQPATHNGRRYAALVVSDTGVGMDDHTQEQLFEPFFTTKKTGTGLGLATVRGIVEQSGGQVSVTSAPGRGATFTILLPLSEQDAPTS